jgi:hypothetical protein
VAASGPKQPVNFPPLKVDPNAPSGGGGGSGLLIAGAVVGGVGVVGLIVGGAFGGLAIGQKNKVVKDCPNQVCSTPSAKSELSSANTDAAVSTAGLVAGGVLVAAGGTMLIVSLVSGKKHSDEKTGWQIVPSAGPSGAGALLFGRF